MASPTRWAIIGASKVANDFIIAMRTLPSQDHKLVAVAARELGRAKEFASKHDVGRAYGSYKELVLDGDVEIVYVSTINVSHKELCLLALNHGKHVLCEKPMMINQKEANEVLALAKEKSLFCMEALWTRFFPLYIDLQEQLKSKDSIVGDVKFVRASLGFNKGQTVPRFLGLDIGGGALLNCGIYCLSLIDMVYNGEMPLSITASGVKTETGVDETVCVNMTYSGNRMGQAVTSIGASLNNDASIAGTKGSIQIAAPFVSPESFTGSDGSAKEYPLPKPDKPLNFPPGTVGMRYEIQGARDSLLAGETESSVVPHSTTLRILGFMDEVRRQIGVVFPQDN